MIKDILKRATAGLLSALTLLTTVPLSGAVDGGVMPLAEEDNEASSIVINVGEVYNIADKGVQKAWFQQNGAPRNVWPMFTEASDGTEIRAYCADHSKGNPGTAGMPYTVTSRVSDMHVYGVAVRSDARMTLNQFISFAGSPITAENFTADMYFSASQAAIWCALGDARIAANSSYGVSYGSSTSLGYRAAGKTLSASSTSEALTLFAAIKMLEYGNEFYNTWGPNGKGHAPWVGATINYTPGNAEYTPAAQKIGSVDLPQGIVNSGVFAEKEIDGQQYMVLPMAAASATFVRGDGEYGQIFVRADNMPSGAFLMDSEGNKSYDDGGSQRLTLAKVQRNDDLYKNGNDMAYGETFLFCIPKDTAEQMDEASTPLEAKIFVSMNADRYNVYAASTTSSGVQPVIMVEPAVQKLSNELEFSPIPTFQDKAKLKILKTDKDGAPLAGCTFQITYEDNGQKTAEKTTDSNGEVIFEQLPLNTDVTIKETAAPEGYQLLPSKVINTGSKGGTVEYTFANSDDHVFKVHKVSSADNRNLMGAKFEVKGIDNDFVNTYTTDALGEFTIQGRDLPTGSFEVYEIAAPEGYATDGADIQTFSWDNTRDVTLTFKNAPLPGIQIYKYDKDSKEPLAGATFEIRRDGQVLQTVKTDVNGYAKVYNIPKGFYEVVEVEPPQNYLKDEVEHEVYIDPSADPTQIVREVNVPNTKKLSIRIIKQDKDTKVPLQGWKFDVYYNDAKLTSVTTDENGEAMIENLQPGTYRVVEVDGDKEHYNLDAPEQTVELIKDQAEIPTLIFQNTIKKHFGIYKIDEETHKPIQGVTFEIWKDGKLLGNYTTDENGRSEIKNAPAGTYKVQEVNTLKEHILNDEVLEIEHTTVKDTELTVENTKKPGLLIKKIDSQTKKPLQGAVFKITKANGEFVKEAETDANGIITLDGLPEGSNIVTEIEAPDGYMLQDMPKTIEVKAGGNYEMTFTNKRAYGLQIRKVIKGTNQPLDGCTFTVEKANGEMVGFYTTDSSGLATVTGLEDGVYVVTEVSCPEGYRLDPEPQNVIVKAGELATVTFENEKLAGVRIKKIDAVTGEGIYGVRFLIKDEHNNLIGEYSTDQDGYIELDDLLTDGKSEIKIKVEEIAAAEGYVLDDTVRTLRIRRGETTELVVENTPILGQIQVVKKSAQDNPVTNQPKGSLLEGAVFEITNADTGRVVDTMTSDSRGIAASNPIPLGRYYVQEIQAPRFYQLNSEKVEVKLKVEGDVVRIEMYNDPANINTSIEKTGNYTVDAGSNMRYDFTNIANNSNVPLDNFFWHDRIPTDAVRAGTLTAGTYNARVWYKITYKTNENDYRTLADNLLSTNRYSFKIDSGSLKLASGEYVTDIRFEFGTVPAGFKMTEKATLLVYVPAYMLGGYNIINRADCGGSYQGEWDNSTSTWVTKICRAPTYTKPTLPQTGF